MLEPKLELEFNIKKDKEDKIEAILDNIIYTNKAKDQLSGLYYFVSWKNYLEDEST